MKPLKKRKKEIFFSKRNFQFFFLPNIGIHDATKKQTDEPNIVPRKIVKR